MTTNRQAHTGGRVCYPRKSAAVAAGADPARAWWPWKQEVRTVHHPFGATMTMDHVESVRLADGRWLPHIPAPTRSEREAVRRVERRLREGLAGDGR